MAARPIEQIKNDYSKYNSIVRELKLTNIDPISFTEDKPSRSDTLYHSSKAHHESITEEIYLLAEQKKNNECSYKFQFRCEKFCLVPVFRFDSDGSAHQNKSAPLGEQQIMTPHFNIFNEKGISLAYQTEELKEVTYADLRDMNRFFSLFCEETTFRTESFEIPKIIPGDNRTLDFDLHSEDLLSDINFDI